jgi:hypothetical protein
MPRPKGKQNKVHIGVWVHPTVAASLEARAAKDHLKLSQAAAVCLEIALTERADEAGLDLYVARLEAAIADQTTRAGTKIADRLAGLISRTALEATALRQFVLMESSGQVQSMQDAPGKMQIAWNIAVDSLTRESKGVQTLLNTKPSQGSSGEQSEGQNAGQIAGQTIVQLLDSTMQKKLLAAQSRVKELEVFVASVPKPEQVKAVVTERDRVKAEFEKLQMIAVARSKQIKELEITREQLTTENARLLEKLNLLAEKYQQLELKKKSLFSR